MSDQVYEIEGLRGGCLFYILYAWESILSCKPKGDLCSAEGESNGKMKLL
jgi:hypothetical protein